MKELKLYQCEYCGKKYETKQKAEDCEKFHNKHPKIIKSMYEPYEDHGMPRYLYLENDDSTAVASYVLKTIDFMDVKKVWDKL